MIVNELAEVDDRLSSSSRSMRMRSYEQNQVYVHFRSMIDFHMYNVFRLIQSLQYIGV